MHSHPPTYKPARILHGLTAVPSTSMNVSEYTDLYTYTQLLPSDLYTYTPLSPSNRPIHLHTSLPTQPVHLYTPPGQLIHSLHPPRRLYNPTPPTHPDTCTTPQPNHLHTHNHHQRTTHIHTPFLPTYTPILLPSPTYTPTHLYTYPPIHLYAQPSTNL